MAAPNALTTAHRVHGLGQPVLAPLAADTALRASSLKVLLRHRDDIGGPVHPGSWAHDGPYGSGRPRRGELAPGELDGSGFVVVGNPHVTGGGERHPVGAHRDPAAPILVELMVTAGLGDPEVASWALVNSTSSLLQGLPKQSSFGPPPVTIHRLPEAVKTGEVPPIEEIVTVGLGLAMASSALENSKRQPWGQVLDTWVVTHRSPEGSRPIPPERPGRAEIVVWGVGEPELANWLLVNS